MGFSHRCVSDWSRHGLYSSHWTNYHDLGYCLEAHECYESNVTNPETEQVIQKAKPYAESTRGQGVYNLMYSYTPL